MAVKREQRNYRAGDKVWVGRYRNSHNLPHWHYDCELIYVENGCLTIFCNQTGYVVSAGQTFFIDSEQVHYMHALTPQTTLSMIIFDYSIIKEIAEDKTLASPLLTSDYGFLKVFRELKQEIIRREPLCEYQTALTTAQLMLKIFRNEGLIGKKKSERTVERFKGLLTEIDEKYEFYDLSEAADYMGMNSAYFSRLFHKLTGVTFSQYLNYIKIKNAVELLQTDHEIAITEVATRSGFNTIRNFNRNFKEFTGYTPKDLPPNYILKEGINNLNEISTNPTLVECELLESSDDPPDSIA